MADIVQFPSKSEEDALWDRLIGEQFDLIKQAYDEEAAACANYGWVSDGSERHIEVCTKVYLEDGNVSITSRAYYQSCTIEHSKFTRIQSPEERIRELEAKQIRSRLDAAFEQLRADGYFARPDWQCCQSCGVHKIPDENADRYVFYHAQDADMMREYGECFLNWSGDTTHIKRRLKEAGLAVKWDGTRETRMKVSPILGH
jgi:hypothetical protein